MVDRFLEPAFCAGLADDRKSWHLMPRDEDVSVLETIRNILGPLSEFTDALSGEKQVTISCVQPVLWKIFKVLNIENTDNLLVSKMKKTIADDLQKRYAAGELPLLLDCAAYFDVRFKKTFVTDPNAAKQRLINEIDYMTSDSEITPHCPQTSSEHDPAAVSEGPASKKRKTGFADVLANRPIRKVKQDVDDDPTDIPFQQSPSVQLNNELVLYDQLPESAACDDQLKWWKENESCFPMLAKLARKYLCVAETSVACEQVFSAGNIVTSKRNRLSAENVDMLTFLAKKL